MPLKLSKPKVPFTVSSFKTQHFHTYLPLKTYSHRAPNFPSKRNHPPSPSTSFHPGRRKGDFPSRSHLRAINYTLPSVALKTRVTCFLATRSTCPSRNKVKSHPQLTEATGGSGRRDALFRYPRPRVRAFFVAFFPSIRPANCVPVFVK